MTNLKGQSCKLSVAVFALVLLLLQTQQSVHADWSGISMSLGETKSSWSFSDFDTDVRQTDIFFRVETAASPELRAGFTLGQSSQRLDPPGVEEVLRYETNFVGVDLRLPYQLSDSLSLEAQVGWRWHSGIGTNDEATDASWSQGWVGLAPGFRYQNLRLEPYWLAHYQDGDLAIDGRQRNFSREQSFSVGLNIDYLVEETGFVRLNIGAGGDEGFLIEFVTRYY